MTELIKEYADAKAINEWCKQSRCYLVIYRTGDECADGNAPLIIRDEDKVSGEDFSIYFDRVYVHYYNTIYRTIAVDHKDGDHELTRDEVAEFLKMIKEKGEVK